MGPRRTTLVLALLALGLLVGSAGVAAASDGAWSHAPSIPTPAPSSDSGIPTATWTDHAHHDSGHDGDGTDVGGTDNGGSSGNGSSGGPTAPDDGHSSGGGTGGDATGSSVDTPSTPVQAPALTASGPAPAAVAPAPIVAAVEAFVPADGATGTDLGAAPAAFDGVAPVADVPALVAPAVPTGVLSLTNLPELGAIGSLASNVSDGPTNPGTLLSSGTGRSVAVVLALLAAILVFLAFHRRVDRGDPKLATARTGPVLARFR